MKNLFKPEMLKVFISILTFLLILKLLWFVVQVLWLSAVDIDQVENKNSKALFYRVKLTPKNNIAPPPVSAYKAPKKISGNIKEIKLLAIYNAEDIAVVTIENKGKTKVLATGDKIKGFTLEGASNNFAMFSKEDKNYKVSLIKNSKESTTKSISTVISPVKSESKRIEGEIINEGAVKIIDRSLLEHYAENMDDIYKNIDVSEIKNGKDLTGFKIKFVRKDSPFAKLGIRRNDVIKSINGEEINSYNSAFSIYKNIKNIDNLNVVIIRGKEEMELEYEIN